MLHRVEVRAEATVHGKNLLVDDSGDRKAVEAIGECLPQLDIVATLALVVEAIDSVDRSALVVTSEDEEVFGVLDLVGKEQANGLKRLLTSVDVVTEEEVVGLRREATVLEESEKIVVLSVDITTDLKRAQAGKSANQKKFGCGRAQYNSSEVLVFLKLDRLGQIENIP